MRCARGVYTCSGAQGMHAQSTTAQASINDNTAMHAAARGLPHLVQVSIHHLDVCRRHQAVGKVGATDAARLCKPHGQRQQQ